ncbi:MAG: T9SS type A sorting domain-containing protein [Dysgonamonadaceae bacterium]|jgi:hypothetical protein|nr:T9SS type A sorting domain-containing protein [Dysgonamonadaceae bacterium]
MKKIILSFFLFLPLYAGAQSLVSTVSGENNGVIWSVGEVLVATLADAGQTTFVTQGFLQPDQLHPVAIAAPAAEIANLYVYPNPVQDKLFVRTQAGSGDWKLYDATGKILNTGQCSGEEQSIDFSCYSPGYYILRTVTQEGTQSMKIVK